MYSIDKIKTQKGILTLIHLKLQEINVSFLDYGAAIYDIETKNANGVMESVVLKYEKLEDYFDNEIYLNATIGPLSGRTKDASFSIDDAVVTLDKNCMNVDNLHSGSAGLSFKTFDYAVIEHDDYTRVMFTYTTDEHAPFKGIQTYQIAYIVQGTSVEIEYKAISSEDTAVNVTNHTYFNLSGNMKKQVLDQSVQILASNKLQTDEHNTPCGIASVTDTYLDFTKSKKISKAFYDGIYDTVEFGIDHQMLLDDVSINKRQVYVTEESSKRTLEVYTSYPVIVFYTHNFVSDKMLSNGKHEQHMGLCFEAQYESNGINVPGFHDSILRKGKEYLQRTIYKFGLLE